MLHSEETREIISDKEVVVEVNLVKPT